MNPGTVTREMAKLRSKSRCDIFRRTGTFAIPLHGFRIAGALPRYLSGRPTTPRRYAPRDAENISQVCGSSRSLNTRLHGRMRSGPSPPKFPSVVRAQRPLLHHLLLVFLE
ncbi:hypothetical protein AWB78_07702 [Caballeronia calidae]|uniref:Uncharacterized protein n=1 Tax=Caballeronia calidae TaxID=1777139 RepID=A0A158EGF8_9BURK|nr:hypothetical protein AWB78_07702 [Caballeronia calidae]